MTEKIKKVFWPFLVPLGVGIILLIVKAVIGGISVKMVHETLMDLDILFVSGVICLIIAVIFGGLYVKQRRNILKSKYDELVKLTKLPPEDEIITIEPAAYQAVLKREKPNLQFRLIVHNHSYYHFTPKRVELKCSNSGKEVAEDVWDKDTDKPEYISKRGYIHVGEQLPKYQPSFIIFEAPIEKRYDDWYDWDLKGFATYTNGEEERNVKIETHHQMSDKNIHKLEEMLKKEEGEEK